MALINFSERSNIIQWLSNNTKEDYILFTIDKGGGCIKKYGKTSLKLTDDDLLSELLVRISSIQLRKFIESTKEICGVRMSDSFKLTTEHKLCMLEEIIRIDDESKEVDKTEV